MAVTGWFKSPKLAHVPIRPTNPTGLRKFRNTEFTLGGPQKG